MALEITINTNQYRNDSTILPRLNISGYTEAPFIKLHNWQYFKAVGASFLLEPNNRSMLDCPVYLRDCKYDLDNWNIDEEIGDFEIVGDESHDGFIRSGGGAEGSWKGAFYDEELDGNIVSVQATAQSTQLSTGISLQDSPFASHNYFDDQVAHAIIFGQNGQLTIRELGIGPTSYNASYRYDIGDTAMIELDKLRNIVRYYLIKNGEMVLLRSTRPKLTTNPIAEILLYFPNSELRNVLIFNGDEAVTTFENIGVAYRKEKTQAWQKWHNPRTRISTAEPIQLADGEFEYTSPTSKKVLRQVALTPTTKNQEGFQNFEDFFSWHGNEKQFIFVDEARKDAKGNPQEYWARFVSGMGDETGNGCLFDYNVQIIEAYRGDYVPKMLDNIAPNVVLGENEGSSGIAIFNATATDDYGVKFCRIFVEGVQVGADVYYSGTNIFSFSFDSGAFSPTDEVFVRAYDYGGNVAQSNTVTIGGETEVDDLLFFGDDELLFGEETLEF